MAFVLKQSDTYSWPVSFEIPVDGRHESQSFKGIFKRMSQKWIRDVLKKIEEEKISDYDVAKEVLAGWEDVRDESDKDIAFTAKALDQLLEIPTVSGAIVVSFFESITGAKEKN